MNAEMPFNRKYDKKSDFAFISVRYFTFDLNVQFVEIKLDKYLLI